MNQLILSSSRSEVDMEEPAEFRNFYAAAESLKIKPRLGQTRNVNTIEGGGFLKQERLAHRQIRQDLSKSAIEIKSKKVQQRSRAEFESMIAELENTEKRIDKLKTSILRQSAE